MNWDNEARNDANTFIEEYQDEIVQSLIDGDEVSDDINNDYPHGDSWFHESFVDKYYDLQEAVDLLDDLDEFEETDSGLWDGQSWRDMISTIAAFTYGNAVAHYIGELVGNINDIDVDRLREEIIDEFEVDWNKAQEELPEDEREEFDPDEVDESKVDELLREAISEELGTVKF